jgi:NADH:ubiquinone oxidoreductase subunit 5 (subunit L)/multisubunit Na+/H+ antiporter MnhA subunit
MWVPLVILAVLASTVGFVIAGEVFRPQELLPDHFALFLSHSPSLAYGAVQATTAPGPPHLELIVLSTILALSGIGCAAYLYLGHRREVEVLKSWLDFRWLSLYRLSRGKFFLDEFYKVIVVQPCYLLARFSDWCDRRIVDGSVNLLAVVPVWVGSVLRSPQGGLISFYGLAMVLGMLSLIAARMLWGGG